MAGGGEGERTVGEAEEEDRESIVGEAGGGGGVSGESGIISSRTSQGWWGGTLDRGQRRGLSITASDNDAGGYILSH